MHDADIGALDEGALLAAYLDGDTDDVTTRRLERRLAEDADLAARLDAVATTRAQLQRLEGVAAPAEVRRRLRQRLAEHRAVPASGPAERRSRWWTAMRLPQLAAAAAVVMVAVLGAAAVLPLLSGGGGESAVQSADGVEGAAAEAGAGQTGDGGLESAEGDVDAEAARSAPQALSGEEADGAAPDGTAAEPGGPAPVTGDADIAARAQRLLDDPPVDLRRRERTLRRDAGLPSEPICVGDLDASTVDLITQDGRTSLAVLLGGGADQIVLVEPRTCAPIRTISGD